MSFLSSRMSASKIGKGEKDRYHDKIPCQSCEGILFYFGSIYISGLSYSANLVVEVRVGHE